MLEILLGGKGRRAAARLLFVLGQWSLVVGRCSFGDWINGGTASWRTKVGELVC